MVDPVSAFHLSPSFQLEPIARDQFTALNSQTKSDKYQQMFHCGNAVRLLRDWGLDPSP